MTRLNRFDRLRFIYNGKQQVIKVIFKEYKFEYIPIFYSDDVNKFKALKINNDNILIINSRFANNTNSDVLDMVIVDTILRNESWNDEIIDLHLAKWFGISNTIKYRDKYCKYNEEKCKKIEKLINNSIMQSVSDMDSILSNISFVEINKIEVQEA